jgi:hypothetical protein
MVRRLKSTLQHLFTIDYSPAPTQQAYLERSQTQETPAASVTAAVLSSKESREYFGVPLARKSIQPVYLRIENRGQSPLRLYVLDIDPHYYTPLEAASLCHFSVLKRFSAFGLIALLFFPIVLLIIPSKLIFAAIANGRIDELFQDQAFPLRPIPPGETASGFVYATLDAGSKTVRVCLYDTGGIGTEDGPARFQDLLASPHEPKVDLSFVIPVPGIAADYLRQDFEKICPPASYITCDLAELGRRVKEMPAATTNLGGTRTGDPVNLVVLGEFETILSAFTSRWDECETITLETCWKTVRAFLFGREYRYSPVSPLYMFGRSQDVALQRIRHSINERIHLRLWLTPCRLLGRSVWIGQISRDIGVRFTTKVWNLTTHRVDPNVDESRDYLVEDLLRAQRIDAVGYVDGVGACDAANPRHNLTGDPYFTDGKRAVIALSDVRTSPKYVAWS